MELRQIVLGAVVLLLGAGCVNGQTQAERGEALYAYCEHCHGSVGEGHAEFRVPAIAGLEQWYVEAQLMKFRLGARGDHPLDLDGLRMRPMSRTLANDTEVVEVSAYVASLDPVNPDNMMVGPEGQPLGNADVGRRLFTGSNNGSQPCVECHGDRGEGKREMNAPPLHHQSDWYLVAQLHKFRQGIRGADDQDASGITMRPQALALEDDQAILDVVAYIETFDN